MSWEGMLWSLLDGEHQMMERIIGSAYTFLYSYLLNGKVVSANFVDILC